MRTGLGGKSLVDVEPQQGKAEFPPHKISTGDIVGLDEYKKDKPKKKAGTSWSGVVVRAADARITIALSGDDNELPTEVQDRCQIMLKALDFLKKEAIPRQDPLPQVLFGQREPSLPQDISDLRFFDETLNDSQKDAVRFALGANEIALVHGPPGTGKTYTLIEIIRQLAKQGKKVLVYNLVERLARHKMNLVRVGHPARILPTVLEHSLDIISRTCDAGQIVADVRKEMDETLGKISKTKGRAERRALYTHLKDLRKDYRARERKVLDEVMTGAQVLISTLNGCGSRNMWHREFDVVIIDEATQALEAECWIALLKGKKAILAGDHLQLPPTVKTPPAPERKKKAVKDKRLSCDTDLTTTLFDRLLVMHGNKVKRMLKVQYRMHAKIMEFSSRELYDDELVADESVASHLLSDLDGVEESDNTNVPVVMIDTSDTGLANEKIDEEAEQEDSKANDVEVDLAVRHVQQLLDNGVTEDQIGVITPYAYQVTQLIRALREQYPRIEIGTVDGFQGREKEAILLSLVRSNDDGEVGFLAEKRRLNVAMTRPKRHLCVICDSDTLSGNKGHKPRNDGGFLRRWMEWLGDESDLRFSGDQ
ncbi:P-loop containing nucleoside triphosphate hydrolase protein [Syncephalastrum racemosum]|uniref:DNA helicase n=1 Tax=Syncephalastrum racemosum TaxID=13706 RepID=A0A1X2HUV2_SYNRA|nr:P-loop containing nucleoside triphosphate hydrolase protein [Syncephalastrum racemosum]